MLNKINAIVDYLTWMLEEFDICPVESVISSGNLRHLRDVWDIVNMQSHLDQVSDIIMFLKSLNVINIINIYFK